jgi:hypothetical protein
MTVMILLSEWERSQTEFWKPIQGWLGYDVSTKGRVRTFKKRQGARRLRGGWAMTNEPQIRKACPDGEGYLYVSLCGEGRKRECPKIHRLVAQAFIPNVDNLSEVNHKTGLQSDNRDRNLEWVTRSQNIQHADRNGLRVLPKGEKTVNAKLTDVVVLQMRQRARAGEPTSHLAQEFGVNWKTASHAISGQTWKHLPTEV